MSQKAIYLQPNVFHFDLQEHLSPTPTVSNEVIQARKLNGTDYTSLQEAIEGELLTLKALITAGLTFVGTTSSKPTAQGGAVGDFYYCTNDGLYYAWTGKAWQVCGDSTKIANGSVTPEKTSFISGSGYPDLFRNKTLLNNKQLDNLGTTFTSSGYNTNRYGIPVQEGKTYTFSINGQRVFITKVVFKTTDSIVAVDGEDVTEYFLSVHNSLGLNSITAPTGAKYMFASMSSSYQSQYGPMSELVVQNTQEPQPVNNDFCLSDFITIPHYVPSNLYGLTMMTLGDDLSAEGEWQEYVSKYLGLKAVKNFSSSGAKVSQFLNYFTPTLAADVDVVFIMGLFNSKQSQPGTVNDAPSSDDNASICAGYKFLIETLYSLNPNFKIVLASPHRSPNYNVADKVKAVGEVAAYYGIPFIDVYNTAAFNDYTYPMYLRDGIYCSYGAGGGYEQEAKVIAGGLIHYFG
ncbi:MAG: SGNH/GDSL hydrolase family protein [Clostridia bacterium]|nr:SGNH/GDSL hydrolase family protein [Clostridia bacterium]